MYAVSTRLDINVGYEKCFYKRTIMNFNTEMKRNYKINLGKNEKAVKRVVKFSRER